MIVKPIQRVCKYPLLFADLFKNLPVIDGPESHATVEKVLFRLRETALEINKATNDEYTRERIQRCWSLQDLLIFPDAVKPSSPNHRTRSTKANPSLTTDYSPIHCENLGTRHTLRRSACCISIETRRSWRIYALCTLQVMSHSSLARRRWSPLQDSSKHQSDRSAHGED